MNGRPLPSGRMRRDLRRRSAGLALLTWIYVCWSILPVLLAVGFSFNSGRSITHWQGFSLRWWVGDPAAAESLWYDPGLHLALIHTVRVAILSTIIAVLLGTMLAVSIDRWRGASSMFLTGPIQSVMMMPEIVLGLALFFAATLVLKPVLPIGTPGQVIGLVTRQIPLVFLIVRARLRAIGREYEEAAADLGSARLETLRRVLLPMLRPALFASASVAVALSIDNFVTVQYLSSGGATETLSIRIYSAARGNPPPAINAAGGFMLFVTTAVAVFGALLSRLGTRGERRD